MSPDPNWFCQIAPLATLFIMTELTILMPCLNEAETLAACIEKARGFLVRSNIDGEVLIADNGSTDGSIEIAEALGAKVVHVRDKGYGSTLIQGIKAAAGRFIVIGDSDNTYDFSSLEPFLVKLRAGSDLVIGNRFQGGIAPGAMPILHKYLGNPLLSFLGRVFFSISLGDFHCGLRGFLRDRIMALGLTSRGMEFATEMIVRARMANYTITEVPTTLSVGGRTRPSHLRTWRDGWRHLRFLLIFSPQWLFLYPGFLLIVFGAMLSLLLLPGPFPITPHVSIDIHSLVAGSFLILIGLQAVAFAIVAHRYSVAHGFRPSSKRLERFLDQLTLERVLVVAAAILLAGLCGVGWCVLQWASEHFGPLEYGKLLRILTLSMTGVTIGLQLALTAFLAAILEIEL